jgi:hypothetical protein
MAAYASLRKVEGLEVKVANLESAPGAQTELIVELRERLLPMPRNLMYDRQQSPAVRQIGAIG